MANPQPDIFIRWSKELWKQIIKKKIPPRPRQVFDAIAYLTYGAIPSVKEKQITAKEIMELTGLNKNQTSKALGILLDSNLVAKNGNYYPPIIRINKDYEKWKELPKMATARNGKVLQAPPKKGVAKNGNRSCQKRQQVKTSTLYNIKNRELVDSLYEFYKNEINPLRKSSQRAKKNIAYHLKKHPFENLKKAILNYKKIALKSEPEYRKDPANFFGKNEEYFLVYLQDNFDAPENSTPKYTTAKDIDRMINE
jgi:phage replication O-like protein O